MSKLCIVFPGRRYSCDRSLLYYPARMIEERDYDMVYLHYDLPKENEDPRPLEQCFSDCLVKAKEQTKDIDFSKYDRILFLSKSIGTAVAGEIEKFYGLTNVHQVMMTPITMTLPYIEKKDLIISSDSDHYLPDAQIVLSNFDNSYLFPKCPHSFEFKGNYALTMKMLTAALGVVEKYLEAINA